MKPRSQVLILVSVLLAFGAGLTTYKCLSLGFTLVPDKTATVWQVQGRIQFDAAGGPAKVSLILPVTEEYRKTIFQEKVADDYRCVYTTDGSIHKAVWTRQDAYGPQVIYYRGDFFYTEFSEAPPLPQGTNQRMF